jgi:hypothetical protein
MHVSFGSLAPTPLSVTIVKNDPERFKNHNRPLYRVVRKYGVDSSHFVVIWIGYDLEDLYSRFPSLPAKLPWFRRLGRSNTIISFERRVKINPSSKKEDVKEPDHATGAEEFSESFTNAKLSEPSETYVWEECEDPRYPH